mgnify:CR=1 FL=1
MSKVDTQLSFLKKFYGTMINLTIGTQFLDQPFLIRVNFISPHVKISWNQITKWNLRSGASTSKLAKLQLNLFSKEKKRCNLIRKSTSTITHANPVFLNTSQLIIKEILIRTEFSQKKNSCNTPLCQLDLEHTLRTKFQKSNLASRLIWRTEKKMETTMKKKKTAVKQLTATIPQSMSTIWKTSTKEAAISLIKKNLLLGHLLTRIVTSSHRFN